MKYIRGIIFAFMAFTAIPCFATTISVDPFVSGNDVTIAHLEQLRTNLLNGVNSIDGGNIQTGSVIYSAMDANANPVNRWNETFTDFVSSGLLPVTGASLTATIPAGTAYVDGFRTVKTDTAKTFTATKWTYVDLAYNGTFTYVVSTIGDAEPATTASSIRLCRVSTDATSVSDVRDDRVLSPGFAGSGGSESFDRFGLEITATPTTTVAISPGYAYHGSSKVTKTSTTTLSLATASDWATGISGRATNTLGFVVMSSSGVIKLTTVAPTLVNTTGDTTGKKRYSVIGGANWRVLAWFYMNGTGSGELNTWSWGNFKDGSVGNSSMVSPDASMLPTLDETAYNGVDWNTVNLPFYSSGGNVLFNGTVRFTSVGSNFLLTTRLSCDATAIEQTESSNSNGTGVPASVLASAVVPLTQGLHTLRIVGKVEGGTNPVNNWCISATEQ